MAGLLLSWMLERRSVRSTGRLQSGNLTRGALPARISTPGPDLVDLFDTSIVGMDKRWVRHQPTSKVFIDGR
jgi:hypothetical protein